MESFGVSGSRVRRRPRLSGYLHAVAVSVATMIPFTTTVDPAHAAIVTYTSRASFDAAVGATTLIDFSTGDDSQPLTNPSSDMTFQPLRRSGVEFPDVQSYYNLLVYQFPNTAIEATPVCSVGFTAAGFDYHRFYDITGTYHIELSTGQTFDIPDNTIPSPTLFFGFVSDVPVEWVRVSYDNTYVFIDNFAFVLDGMQKSCDDTNGCTQDSCDPQSGCVSNAEPAPICRAATQAKLDYDESTPGREKMKVQWKRIDSATTQGAFGDPVTGGTRVDICIYDDGDGLLQRLSVDRAGQLCDGKPCWKAKGTKGYGYKDKGASADGIGKLGFGAGDAGKGKALAGGKNDAEMAQTALPTGVVTGLSGNSAVTIQMVTSDGFCVGATMNEVKKDEETRYSAQLK